MNDYFFHLSLFDPTNHLWDIGVSQCSHPDAVNLGPGTEYVSMLQKTIHAVLSGANRRVWPTDLCYLTEDEAQSLLSLVKEHHSDLSLLIAQIILKIDFTHLKTDHYASLCVPIQTYPLHITHNVYYKTENDSPFQQGTFPTDPEARTAFEEKLQTNDMILPDNNNLFFAIPKNIRHPEEIQETLQTMKNKNKNKTLKRKFFFKKIDE